MSGPTPRPSEEQTHPPIPGDDRDPVDSVLEILVGFANDTGTSMSLTVHVGGGIVTGLLVGYAEWLRLVSEKIRVDTPTAAGVLDPLVTAEHEHQEQRGAQREDAPFVAPRHLHLRDAHFIDGGNEDPPLDRIGFLWRGRLSEVSGWTLSGIIKS